MAAGAAVFAMNATGWTILALLTRPRDEVALGVERMPPSVLAALSPASCSSWSRRNRDHTTAAGFRCLTSLVRARTAG